MSHVYLDGIIFPSPFAVSADIFSSVLQDYLISKLMVIYRSIFKFEIHLTQYKWYKMTADCATCILTS